MSYPYILAGNTVTIMANGKMLKANDTHVNFSSIVDAIKAGEWEQAIALMDIPATIVAQGRGIVTVENGMVMYDDRPVHNTLTDRMLAMLRDGFDIQPMIEFLQRLMKNPLQSAIDELYSFMEAGQLPITPDGYLLAYKRVANDYYDLHSRRVLNKPASLMSADELTTFAERVEMGECFVQVVDGVTEVSMDRTNVDANRAATCSYGLHFCSYAYLNQFHGGSGRIVVVKIDPADVVSIPSDYNDTKGRTCKYQVVYELETVSSDLDEPVLTDLVMEVDEPVVDGDVDTNYIQLYIQGYKCGRNKQRKDDLLVGKDAYDAGYKDGRKRVAARYTLDDLE